MYGAVEDVTEPHKTQSWVFLANLRWNSLPTSCEGTHFFIVSKGTMVILRTVTHMIPRVNREADKNRSFFFLALPWYSITIWLRQLVLHRESWQFFLGSMCYCAILLCWPNLLWHLLVFDVVFRNGEVKSEISQGTSAWIHWCLPNIKPPTVSA